MARLQRPMLRLFSTDLPSNLKLSTVEILAPPQTPLVQSQDMLFGTMDVPKSIVVNSFNNPDIGSFGQMALDDLIFGVAMRKDIVHHVIRYLRAKRRQPQKTKRIWEISGSNKKPRPQKGSGRSQVGHIRNSAWRGGQKAHGPVLRDFSFSLNKKYRALGMMIALAAKLREGNLVVFDTLACDSHKTKALRAAFLGHGFSEFDRLLCVDIDFNENFELAARNLKNVTFVLPEGVNVINVVKNEKLICSQAALDALQERLRDQYTHKQRRKAYLAGLQTIADAQPTV